jgi:hypothetical protein
MTGTTMRAMRGWRPVGREPERRPPTNPHPPLDGHVLDVWVRLLTWCLAGEPA